MKIKLFFLAFTFFTFKLSAQSESPNNTVQIPNDTSKTEAINPVGKSGPSIFYVEHDKPVDRPIVHPAEIKDGNLIEEKKVEHNESPK